MRSTKAPTSTRAIPATTPALSPSGARATTTPCWCWEARRPARRARCRSRACVSGPGSTAIRCRRWRCWICAANSTRCTRARAGRSPIFARAGGKAIVLLNRRGWSNFLLLPDPVAEVWMCPNCEVAYVVLHRGRRRFPRLPSLWAPQTGARPLWGSASSVAIARHGAGTERIEQRAESRPWAGTDFPVLRLDADSAGLERGQGRGTLPGASYPRAPGCWWARRWSPRGTTSRMSGSGSCSMPIRRCASPTSAARTFCSRW